MDFYLPIAAKNKGWTIEWIQEKSPYLLKFSKGNLFFYSTKYVSLDINHQSPDLADNKLLTQTILNKEGVPVITLEKLSVGNVKESELLYRKFSLNDSTPVILKPIDSFGGKGVIKCDNYRSFLNIIHNINQRNYCISTYFDHFIEVRFLILFNNVEIIHPKFDNTDNKIRPKLSDGTPIGYSTFQNMKKEALKVASILNYDFLAVDFLVSKEDFKVIEININPSLLKFYDASEKNKQKAIKLYEKMFDYKEQLLQINIKDEPDNFS